MDTYREYPIRCKSCNNQIACHAAMFEELMSISQDPEDTFAQMNVRNWCCRAAYTNPSVVMFDMEMRSLIEGYEYIKNTSDASGRRMTKPPLQKEPEEAEEERLKVPAPLPAEGEAFKYPTMVGVPTINSDPRAALLFADAGICRSRILQGRTYLGR